MRKIYLFGIIFLSLMINSCTKDINKDPNYPTTVDADKFFSSGIMWTGSIIGGDLELLGGLWSQHYAQNAGSNQYTNLDSYNLPNNNTYITRTWGSLYSGALPDLQIAMEKSEAVGAWNYWMASKIMTAYCYHLLVDAYGNIPFSQALNFDLYKTPAFDDAKGVNASIIAMLDAALAKKASAAAASPSMGASDLVFGGDIDMWGKFAKSLKLKILMRDPAFATNKAAIQALITEDDLLDADCKITIFQDKESGSNPLYENDRRKLNTTNNLRASSTLSLFLFKYSDPRAGAFMDAAGTPDPVYGSYVGLPQGGYTLGATYQARTSRATLEATDAVYFMSLAEVLFLKAEVNVLLNDPATAKTNYDDGVTEAFSRWKDAKDVDGLAVFSSTFNVNNFIGAGKPYAFDQTSATTMLESIWRQKWIAAVRCQAWESFCDANRTGYPKIGTVTSQDPAYVVGNYAPSINSVLGGVEIPRRLIYPKTSADYNSNTPVSAINTKLWWHK